MLFVSTQKSGSARFFPSEYTLEFFGKKRRAPGGAQGVRQSVFIKSLKKSRPEPVLMPRVSPLDDWRTYLVYFSIDSTFSKVSSCLGRSWEYPPLAGE